MQLPNGLHNLPPWALPVAVGGAGGIFVLMRHKSSPSPIQPIPVGGTNDGTTTANSDTFTAALKALGLTLTDSFGALSQQETANAAAMLAQNQSTMDTITALLTAQGNQSTQQLGALQTLYTSSFSGINDILAQMMQLITHPPSTGLTSIIDALRAKFGAAFARIAAPPGTAQPGTDITVGTLSNAPYAQDTGFTYYGNSGHYVTGPFRQFLGTKGGARTWGYPISQVFQDNGVDTQVFERVILKYIPGANPGNYDIVVVPLAQ